ncbi:MAG: UDP-4-amino-4,6-dideoxy-N-acetyl-beta-L-altrosamine transaminase, partial [Desulfuromonadaceae bacterium]|nr:UDP-4-amino-4,6-dideoxy-N-acetyl-beta-L-altrosamine transaminase [Desulfuromonadaceae bacterium]
INSATSALHIACLAAGLGHGDILWTSPNTFVASANCALYCGATVDFVDIDPLTYNMSTASLEEKLIKARESGRLPKVVIPVHFAGQPCEMARIAGLGREYGFTVIEDASHAIGAKYRGEAVGNCRYSDMTIFSFHPVKIITTGEGGMVTTNNRRIYEQLLRLRSHGITRDASLMDGNSHGAWYYQQIELGFNYRMTDMQAALGTSQMMRLDEFVSRRHTLVHRYNSLLAGFPLTLPSGSSEVYSAFHLYVVKVDAAKTNGSRRQLFDTLRAANIGVNVHYIPVHTQPYYRQMGFGEGMFPQTEQYYNESISLPMYADMTEAQQDRVVSTIRDFFDN